MSDFAVTTLDPAVGVGRRFLAALLRGYGRRDFSIRFWDGTSLPADDSSPDRFTLVLKHPGSLRRMFLPPGELTLAEAFIRGDFDIEGDLREVFDLADFLIDERRGVAASLRLAALLRRLPGSGWKDGPMKQARLHGARHSRNRDREAISYHYDVSNQFYQLWLDSRMIYTCAYFTSPDDDLERAQISKLEYICRKLRLQPGMKLLDIGCGWGGLLIYAAEHYGVEAHGVTLSRSQYELANERIGDAGLAERCRVELCDYRDIEGSEVFDAIVSVGMVEHVGEKQLPEYFTQAWRLLKPRGVFLNHGIGEHPDRPVGRGPSFATRYAFPDRELVSISTMLGCAESAGFEVRDVENLREHYRLTVSRWVDNMVRREEEIRGCVDEATRRIWLLCMAGAAHEFGAGRHLVYQALLSKSVGGDAGLPLTREDWYIGNENIAPEENGPGIPENRDRLPVH